MKKMLFGLALSLGLSCAFAQTWTGTFTTNRGELRLAEQKLDNSKTMVYGDFGNRGTFVGTYSNSNPKKVEGTYFDGNQKGTFVLNSTTISGRKNVFLDGKINPSGGFKTTDTKWTGERTSSTKPNIQNGKWSGLWGSEIGDFTLEQVENQANGTFKGSGKAKGLIRPKSNEMTGSLTKGAEKFEFTATMNGDRLTGRYWPKNMPKAGKSFAAMRGPYTAPLKTTGIDTSGVKAMTTQPEVPAPKTSTGTPSPSKDIKIRVRLVQAGGPGFTYSSQGMTAATIDFLSGSSTGLYGFAGFEPKRVNPSGAQPVRAFGNKSKYIFETTENKVLTSERGINFSSGPDFYRDYIIPRADWENPNYQFELEAFHHLKYKRTGPNQNCEKVRKNYDLKELVSVGKQFMVQKAKGMKVTPGEVKPCTTVVIAQIIE